MVLFQCLGITGIILMFYGLMAFAVTQASTAFFWVLLGLGAAMTIVFVVTSLSKHWQATVGTFVAANAVWICLLVGKAWPVLSKFSDASWYQYVVMGSALVLNGLAVYLSRIFLKDLFHSRSLQHGSSAAVYTAIFVAIIVVANVASNDKHHQWDFTEEKINQLTDQTVKVLQNLKEPVKIYAFTDDRNPEKQGVKDLLGMYKFASKKVELKFVDADKDKTLAMQFKAKDGDVLVEYGKQQHTTQEMTEEGITQAILKVTRNTTPTVCFTKSHGELNFDGADDDARSLSAIKGGLTNEGYQTKGLDSIAGEVPGDCGVLVVAGPTQAFTAEEAKAVDKYLENGGRAAFLLDPNVPDPRLATKNYGVLPTGLEDVLNKWGVEVGRNMILEKHLELLRGVQIGLQVIATNYGAHPIVDPMKGGKQTVFQNVRSVKPKAGFAGTATTLISSAGESASWAESNIDMLFHQQKAVADGADIAGPVSIAVAVEKERPKEGDAPPSPTRLVVFGDADFVSNGMVHSYEFNFDLFLNTLNWMQGEVEQISIRPKKLRSSAIELSPAQSNSIFYVAIIGIPMLVLIFGMDLWWWRRRRG